MNISDLEPKYKIEDFLPPPTVPQITIDKIGTDQQSLLHHIVQQVYAINRDDFNTREILMTPAGQRGRFFDDLRKNYPVRREFQNTKVDCTSKNMANILAGLGFKVSDEK